MKRTLTQEQYNYIVKNLNYCYDLCLEDVAKLSKVEANKIISNINIVLESIMYEI